MLADSQGGCRVCTQSLTNAFVWYSERILNVTQPQSGRVFTGIHKSERNIVLPEDTGHQEVVEQWVSVGALVSKNANVGLWANKVMTAFIWNVGVIFNIQKDTAVNGEPYKDVYSGGDNFYMRVPANCQNYLSCCWLVGQLKNW